MKRVHVFLVMCAALLCCAHTQENTPLRTAPITVKSTRIASFEPGDPSRTVFGALEFRGGLVLASEDKRFGGLSALHMHADGENFLAMSDRATWFLGRMAYERDCPVGITELVAAPVMDENGNPAPRWDTESLACDGRTLYVGLERTNSIYSFQFDWKNLPGRATPVKVPPQMKELPFNQGPEGLVFVSGKNRLAGTIIVFSEQGLTREGNLKAFLIGGRSPGVFAVKRTDSFDISDAATLPGGDILILERLYSVLSGVQMRIRRLRLDDIRPGAVVDGPILIHADARFEIDNMEALSVHQSRTGETILTLMSDDNFSAVQRTLLLQFVLKDPQHPPRIG